MTIRREDLAAAAAVGLLQCRQVDPLLVFLLQRDVYAQRQVLAAQMRGQRRHPAYALLFGVAAVLAIVVMGWFGLRFAMHPEPIGVGMLLSFVGLYVMAAVGIVGWFGRDGGGGAVRPRTVSALVLASVPLAVLTLVQLS